MVSVILILLVFVVFLSAVALFAQDRREFTHTNPKPKTRPPAYQAPMSPLVRKHSKEIARAVRNRQKMVILDGKLYELKEVYLNEEYEST